MSSFLGPEEEVARFLVLLFSLSFLFMLSFFTLAIGGFVKVIEWESGRLLLLLGKFEIEGFRDELEG